MTSFKSQSDLLTALPGNIYSFEGATLKASTPPSNATDARVATTEWVASLLGMVADPPTVMDAGGLNITYTGGVVVNPVTNAPMYISGSISPVAVGDRSTEYIWVRYLDEAVIASSTLPNNNQGYLLATVITNGTGIASIRNNTNAAGWAPINDPSFSGSVTVPSPSLMDNSNKAATTTWVRSIVQSTLVGSDFPTLSITSSGTGVSWSGGSVIVGGVQYPVLGGQYMFTITTSGVMGIYAVVIAGTTMVLVSAVAPTGPNALLGTVSVASGTVGQVNLPPTTGFAPIASPVFSGNPQAPTPGLNDRANSIATTGWVIDAMSARMGVGFGGYLTYLP
jgi:hypothetical protein